jgi:hypothetical protein
MNDIKEEIKEKAIEKVDEGIDRIEEEAGKKGIDLEVTKDSDGYPDEVSVGVEGVEVKFSLKVLWQRIVSWIQGRKK